MISKRPDKKTRKLSMTLTPEGRKRTLKYQSIRPWIYPLLLASTLVSWASYISVSDSWSLFSQWWPMSVTMAFGSFVAGATPLGGNAIAFPVFTKLLHIPSHEAPPLAF